MPRGQPRRTMDLMMELYKPLKHVLMHQRQSKLLDLLASQLLTQGLK